MFQITMTGTLGRDAEEKELGGGKFLTFSVAHNEKKKDSNGQFVESTIWIDVIYNSNGGTLIDYLKRGTKVLIQGVPRVNAYMNKDNQPVAGISVRAYTIELIGGKQDNQQSNASPQVAAPTPKRNYDGDSLPF